MAYSYSPKFCWATVWLIPHTFVVTNHVQAAVGDFQSLPPLNARPPKWKLMIDAKMI